MKRGRKNANSSKMSTSNAISNDTQAQNGLEPSSNSDLIEMIKLLISASDKHTDSSVQSGVAQCDKLVSVLRERIEMDRLHTDNEIFKLHDSLDKLKAENQALVKRVYNAET